MIKCINFFDSTHFQRLGQKSKNNFVRFLESEPQGGVPAWLDAKGVGDPLVFFIWVNFEKIKLLKFWRSVIPLTVFEGKEKYNCSALFSFHLDNFLFSLIRYNYLYFLLIQNVHRFRAEKRRNLFLSFLCLEFHFGALQSILYVFVWGPSLTTLTFFFPVLTNGHLLHPVDIGW